ncbi:MAG TPA: hypothetical protein VFM18_22340 [Methanosarcina sp.]|nr:hypothetical protein [Methanosarcina sp.]
MTEWLLVLIIQSGVENSAIATIKVPDKKSCIRAGKFHESKSLSYKYECIEITKDKL